MGWSGHILPHTSGKWKLYTRGGTNGVFIKHDDRKEEIEIRSDMLRMLVAEDIRSELISKIESMDTEEILNCITYQCS